MFHSTSSSQFPRHGSLQQPLDTRFRQSSLAFGLGLALAGMILLPGTVLIIENQIHAGERLWMEYIFPFSCLVGSGFILLVGLAQSIEAQYCRRNMRRLGKITRARIIGYYLDGNELGAARYAIYEFDVLGSGSKAGRYIVQEIIPAELYHRLEKQEYALVQYLPQNPTLATLRIEDKV